MRSTNRHSFIRSLKRKGFKEEIVIKIGLYDLVTSTTLESNKSQVDMAAPMPLIYKILFPSISTFETPLSAVANGSVGYNPRDG